MSSRRRALGGGAGNKDNVITLLLPGMDGTGLLFDAFARHLAPRLNPRIVIFPTDVSLTYDELLQRIDVPTKPFAIVAESFSGPLGIRLANKFADTMQLRERQHRTHVDALSSAAICRRCFCSVGCC
jgi:hypothetical protein